MVADIIPDTWEIVPGDGWYALERSGDDTFRWVENDAIVFVTSFEPAAYRVTLDIEPGPGVADRPMRLSVLEDAEHCVLDVEVYGRGTFEFVVAAVEPTLIRLRLHVSGGGARVHDDPRVLNFRVFAMRAHRFPPDVVPIETGCLVGRNWFDLETDGVHSFRWIDNDAVIEIGERCRTSSLQLEFERGPSAYGPVSVSVRDAAGEILVIYEVDGITSLLLPIPQAQSGDRSISLHVEGGDGEVPGDPRRLNLRAFVPLS